MDQLNSYNCNCSDTGYTGEHCENNIDDCTPNPCSNDGKCQDGIKDYSCICHDGYEGKNCEKDLDECEKQPCAHGGACLQHSDKSLYKFSMDSVYNASLPEHFNSAFNYSMANG